MNENDDIIELESGILDGTEIEELFYLDDVQRRRLYLENEVTQEAISTIVKHILRFNFADMGVPVQDRQPIILYISSIGGDYDAGMQLIDTIEASVTPVWTVNLGNAYSMAFYISLAGHERFTMPNAKFLMHDGSMVLYDSVGKLKEAFEFHNRILDKIKRFVLEHSALTSAEFDDKYRTEWYMFAEEAIEKGFVDHIIGKDCSLEEVV